MSKSTQIEFIIVEEDDKCYLLEGIQLTGLKEVSVDNEPITELTITLK